MSPPPTSAPAGSRRLLLVILALVLVLVGVFTWLAMQASSLAAAAREANQAPALVSSSSDDTRFRGALAPPLLSVPDVSLASSAGGTFNPYDARDTPVTLFFSGYTRCPDVCPATLASLAAALRTLDAADRDRVQVVFLTTDPAHDTPAALATYLERFDSRFVGVSGAAAELLQVSRALGLPDPTRDGTVHSGQVTSFTRGGQPAVAWTGDVRPADVAHDLKVLLADG